MEQSLSHTVISCAQMGQADQLTIEAGTTGFELMEQAGTRVAEAAVEAGIHGPVLVLAGPGNNGGDAYVAARLLRERGYSVTLAGQQGAGKGQGDAARAAARWGGPVVPLETATAAGFAMVIDGLFGAGLSRDVTGALATLITGINSADLFRLAIDVPSGLDGDSGQVRGVAVQAHRTVTFYCRKPGHLFAPGRELCGQVIVGQIGIAPATLSALGPLANDGYGLSWLSGWPVPPAGGHKYDFGKVLVRGPVAPWLGAGRLAARAALRVGAGLVSLTASPEVWPVQAAALDDVMVAPLEKPTGWAELCADVRITAFLLGPGNGTDGPTRQAVLQTLADGRPVVLDADALSAFRDDPQTLLDAGHDRAVLTPHAGEFRRIFGGGDSDPLSAARRAAARSGAVVVLKGPDTVVAAPSGEAFIFARDMPQLAKGGTGDVLAGAITGLLAQGLPPLIAAAAGCWLQRRAAEGLSRGVLASELADRVADALEPLESKRLQRS